MNSLATLSGARRILLWAAVLSGLLLAMLDQTIVGTALPVIVDELGGRDWYVWGVTAYLVPATVLLPVFARLSDRYGRRNLLLVGLGLFLAGSALCALAQTMGQVIAFRGVQGAGAAALETLSFTLVTELSGARRSGAAQAALAGVMAVSFLGGPLIGGMLTDHLGWRWIFLVNLPLGVAAMAVVARVLPAGLGRHEDARTPLDLLGILTLVAALGALLVGLTQHSAAGTWGTPRSGGLVVLGLAGLGLLAAVERRAAAPVIRPVLVTGRVTGRLLAAGATGGFALYACVLLLPRYFELARGVSATRAGLLLYPLLLTLLVAVNVGVTAIVRIGAFRGVLVGASGLVLLAAAGFALFDASSPAVAPLVLMALVGAGVGPGFSGLQVAVSRAVAPAELGGAMGTLLLGRQVGGAIALAAASALYDARTGAGASAASATGTAICIVSAVGALVAIAALAGLRREDATLDPVAGPAPQPTAA